MGLKWMERRIFYINFDLAHVLAMAPECEGVTHVVGDMFASIPPADAFLLKWILHDWNDEYCIKILKNCRKALPKKTGKLIMVDAALNSQGNEWFDYMRLICDLAMMVHVQGKERSEAEWKIVLEEGGFASHKIITIPAMPSITEAYP
ncbi:xanthohumol 4-O-methyltransferase-like [Hevea brasiliensis]|uniref:xanthohumol 4-O-methyltransferase-like n=1 Tax=Hevea brasiliensis TaxID=3981 RepID=UPI0025E145CF|nr:xanthohumol 4-O-methyltransferase-like [Hevea brasiliensis]